MKSIIIVSTLIISCLFIQNTCNAQLEIRNSQNKEGLLKAINVEIQPDYLVLKVSTLSAGVLEYQIRNVNTQKIYNSNQKLIEGVNNVYLRKKGFHPGVPYHIELSFKCDKANLDIQLPKSTNQFDF